LVSKDDITEFTGWYFCEPNEGWKLGMRVMKWRNNKKIRVQFQKYRTNKLRKWVTSPKSKAFYVDLDDFIELFNPDDGLAIEMLNEHDKVLTND